MKALRRDVSFHPVSLFATLALGVVLAAPPAPAQTLTNGSFEADAFAIAPGYINANSAITGWTASRPDLIGLNPAGGASTFANNGAVPQGTQVAFIRGATGVAASLSTTITGLTPGTNYMLRFRMNSGTVNTNNTNATVRVALDNVLLASFINVQPVGGANPYRPVALPFTATAATHVLSLTNDRSANCTALLDDFTVGVSTTGWSVSIWTNDATCDVDPSRHYTHAVNFGNTANTAVVNGVTFFGLAGANPGAEEMGARNYASTYTSDDANAITTNAESSAELAKRFVYNGDPETISIGGLVPGAEYVATFYTVGWEAGLRIATFSAGDDRLTVNQDQFGNNIGMRISVRYTAPSNGVMTLTITPFQMAASLTTIHTYAFSNYEVPAATPSLGPVRPSAQTTIPGSTVRFRAGWAGAQPVSLQWLKDGVPIVDETNATLSVTVADGSSTGGYALVASSAGGSVTSAVSALNLGPIANPGFEADTFFVWPGYISGNGPISGWTTALPGQAGINPLGDGQGPFANNGIVPEGAQVGFIQKTNSLATTLTGLTPGQTYSLSWKFNARGGYTRALLHNYIDATPMVDMGITAGGAAGTTNPYRQASFDFIASAASHTLMLSNDVAGDTTALIDDFRLNVSTSRWSFVPWTDDTASGVNPSRNYTHAFKFGGPADPTINGVRFKALAGPNPSVAGQFAVSGFPTVYYNDANFLTVGGGGSALLARDFIYGAASQSITVMGLVPGVEYLASLYAVAFDLRTYGRAATFNAGGDSMTINLDEYGQDNGIRVMYRYVADSSGSITLNYVPTDTASTFHTYGFSNCELASTNAPSIYRPPQGAQWVSSGSEVTLYALAGGQAPLSYQWQKDGADLLDQTNSTLTLAGVTAAEAGAYRLIVSNSRGAITTAVSSVEVGLPVVNPGFEADSYYVYPGYMSNNTPITGWANTSPNIGVNPISYTAPANNPNDRPFANNGTIPEGRQVAFLQGNGTLSQSVSGFTVGSAYVVKYYENARAGQLAPSNSVTVGGTTVMPMHEVPTGGYRVVISEPFVATAETMDLAFVKDGGDSVLLDQVAVLPLSAMQPQIAINPTPASQWAVAGETVQYLASATGSLPLFLQWERNGVAVDGETNSTLSLGNIALNQAGSYRLVASNQYGSATSSTAYVQVGLALGELFNTGVDGAGAPAAGDTVDLHYRMVYSDDPAHPGPDAYVLLDAYPAVAGTYMTNGPNSKWIAPMSNAGGFSDLPGYYVYRTTFFMDVTDPSVARIDGRWAVDNFAPVIRLNGAQVNTTTANGFNAWATFAITNGFVAGTNVLEFVTSNAPPAGPTAFRAELRGVGVPLPPGPPQVVNHPQNTIAQELQGVTFAVVGSGAAPLTFQWYRNGEELPGETNRTLFLLAAKSDEAGYRAAVINPSGSVTSDVAMLTVNRPPIPLNDTMAALPDTAFAFSAAKLLRNDSDPDGDPLGVTAVSGASTNAGTAALAGGVVTYTPPAGYTGADLFTYTVGDGRGGLTTTNVTILVDPAAFLVQAPVAPVRLNDGSLRVRFAGMPDCTYTIEMTTNLLVAGSWTPVTNLTADGTGLIELIEPPSVPPKQQRYYRAVYP